MCYSMECACISETAATGEGQPATRVTGQSVTSRVSRGTHVATAAPRMSRRLHDCHFRWIKTWSSLCCILGIFRVFPPPLGAFCRIASHMSCLALSSSPCVCQFLSRLGAFFRHFSAHGDVINMFVTPQFCVVIFIASQLGFLVGDVTMTPDSSPKLSVLDATCRQ